MPRPASMREVLEALEWVRPQVFRRGSPDFIRARQAEVRVAEICGELLRQPRRKNREEESRHRR
jgi:hypothetical protein